MTGHRFFVAPQDIHGSTMRIESPQDVHHIRDVLRLRTGDQLICFDGTGSEYLGTIRTQAKGALVVDITRRRAADASRVTLWLAQGLPKADRFDWVVQKATELGVSRLAPLITRHAVVRLTAEQGRKKWTRWQRIAKAAAQQCGRAAIPTIDLPQPFDRWVATAPRLPLLVMPTLAVTATPLRDVLKTAASVHEAGILIGPEGDFSQEEVALAQTHGAHPVSLGPLTLRSETAAIATLAILRYVLGP